MKQEPLLIKRDLPLLLFCVGYLTVGFVFALAVRPSGTASTLLDFLAYLTPWALPLTCLLWYELSPQGSSRRS